MSRLRSFPIIGILVATFAALSVIYSVATPIFEASDEVSHYAVVQHIADTGTLRCSNRA